MRSVVFGLGLMLAGAVLHGSLGAQVRDTIPRRRDSTAAIPIPPGADSLARDSIAKLAAADSAKRAAKIADSLKAPLARAELPYTLGIAQRVHWNRDSLFATGALTLADLLEPIVGMSMLKAGWIAAPAVGSYLGDTRRVRVFFDGLEELPLDPRGGGALDLTQINLWAAEEVTVERVAEEVRVYIRSWRVRNTTPETRADVATGDQQTNLYRGFFGKRFDNGGALQFGAQQFGTTPPAIFGSSSDQLGVFGRVGWAKKKWSADLGITRVGRHRGTINHVLFLPGTLTADDSLPSVESTRADYYARVGYADPDTNHFWAQGMAVLSRYDYTGTRTFTIPNPQTPEDSAFNTTSLDSGVTRTQFIGTAGVNAGPLRLSATNRLITGGGSTFNVPSVRLSFGPPIIRLSVFGEAKGIDSTARADVSASFTPISFLAAVGSIGRTWDSRSFDTTYSANYARAEGGIRVKGLWFLGGAIHRDGVVLPPPTVFDSHTRDSLVAVNESGANGFTAAIRGRLWRSFYTDLSAVRWNDSTGAYRPQYQTRSEVYVKTNLLDHFPSGDFGLAASLVHEYRSNTYFPMTNGYVVSPGYRTINWLLEIRILSATISWQFRNMMGARYTQVPGFFLPRQTNFYGVRWTFYN